MSTFRAYAVAWVVAMLVLVSTAVVVGTWFAIAYNTFRLVAA